jgi:tetratricopeptide (TPR) repeat protein
MINRNLRVVLPVLALLLLATTSPIYAGWDEGVAAFKAGDFNTAAKEFKTVTDQQPTYAGGHQMLGQALLKLNRDQEALTHLRKAYDLNPNDLRSQLLLGQAYTGARRYADAAALLGKIDPSALPTTQRGALHQMLAVALEKSGQTDRAYAELGKAARLSPNDANLQFQYGTAALKSGNTAAALTALDKAMRLDPRDPKKKEAYVKAALTKARTSGGSAKQTAYRTAVTAGKALVAASPTFDNLMLLGGAQLGAKQYDDAIKTYTQASTKKSSDWLPNYYIGQAYTVKTQYRSAESALKQALDTASSPKDKTTVWKQLGFVYEKQKNYGQAVSAYQRAGDTAAAKRVDDNRKTAEFNAGVEAQNAEIEALKAEEEALKEALKNLPGGGTSGGGR